MYLEGVALSVSSELTAAETASQLRDWLYTSEQPISWHCACLSVGSPRPPPTGCIRGFHPRGSQQHGEEPHLPPMQSPPMQSVNAN